MPPNDQPPVSGGSARPAGTPAPAAADPPRDWIRPAESRQEPSSRPRRIAPALLVVAGITILALVLSTRFLNRGTPGLDLDLTGRVAVLPVVNATGDPGDGWTVYGLAEMAAATLSRTEGVQVIAGERLFEAIRERRLDAVDPAVRDRLRHLATALGADVVVDLTLRKRGAGAAVEARYAAELRLFGAGGEIATGELRGPGALEAADRVVTSIARGLAAGRVPVEIAETFSRDPFVDRLYGMGLQELRSAGPGEAQPYFEIALRSRPSFLQARARLAECVQTQGEADRSRELTLSVLEDAQARGDRLYQTWSFRTLARLAAAGGRFDEAQEHYSRAFSRVLDVEDPMARADLLFELARLASARGDTTRAEELFVEVLQVRQEIGDRLGESEALLEIGSLFKSRGDLDGARDVFRQARQIADGLGDVWTETRILSHLGDVARRQGDLPQALELWRQAAGFYELHDDRARTLQVSRQLADVLVALEDFENAEDLLHQVIDLAAEQKRPDIEAEASLRLTWVLLKSGYPLQARVHLDRTLALDRWLDGERHYLQVVIGWFAYEQGNYSLAVKTLREAKRQAAGQWPAWSEEYLRIFEDALAAGRRLALPGEDGYSAPPVDDGRGP